MAADRDRRTLSPTARRLREARRHGQAPRSRDLLAVLGLVGPLLTLGLAAEPLVGGLRDAMAALFMRLITPAGGGTSHLGSPEVLAMLAGGAVQTLAVCVGVAAAAAMPVLLGGALYNGWLFALRAPMPRLERLSPAGYLERLFSVRTVVELLKSLVKLAAIVGGLVAVVAAMLPTLVLLPVAGGTNLARLLEREFMMFFGWTLALSVVLAGLDAVFQRSAHHRTLRMTVEEWRRERRDDEGDPQWRAHRRERHRESLASADPESEERNSPQAAASPARAARGAGQPSAADKAAW